MIDISSLSVVVAATGVVIAVTYHILNLRNSIKTRQAQLFMGIYDRFTSTKFHMQGNAIRYQWEWSDFDFVEKYGPETNLEAWCDLLSVVTVFEGMGVLTKRKLVDVDMVDELMLSLITRTWERIEPVIIEYGERFEWPQAFKWFEYLYNEMNKREQLAKE